MSINIITKPSVYLVGKQQIDESELNRFLTDEGVESWSTDTLIAGERLVETAGRLCYMSFAKPRPGGNKAYINHLLEVGHGSVLEGAVFNFIISGVSRSFTHELVRSRAGFSYSQLSQRFVDESECRFVMPPLILDLIEWDDVPDPALGDDDDQPEETDELWLEWTNAVNACRKAYESLESMISTRMLMRDLPSETWHDGEGPESFVELNDAIASYPTEKRTALRKQAREAARSVLPNATETKIFVTVNARAARHFIEMRGSSAADAEIRAVATELLRVLQVESPNLFGDYSVVDGAVTTPYRKV